MTTAEYSTVPSLLIAWAKWMAKKWTATHPRQKKVLREIFRGGEKFWEILELINTMPNPEPTFGLALTAHEIWRNHLSDYPYGRKRTSDETKGGIK